MRFGYETLDELDANETAVGGAGGALGAEGVQASGNLTGAGGSSSSPTSGSSTGGTSDSAGAGSDTTADTGPTTTGRCFGRHQCQLDRLHRNWWHHGDRRLCHH